jgi:hypothetical protein
LNRIILYGDVIPREATMKRFIFLAMALSMVAMNALAVDKTVAVMNFRNYGGQEMKGLSRAIPDAISGALSGIRGLRVLERNQLGTILDEIALEQSGAVDTKGVIRAGRLAQAEILVLGSVSGNDADTVLTMKAVRVDNGTVLFARTIRHPRGDLLERAVFASRSMGAVISGLGAGRISVSSYPPGASVYVDGSEAGTTPLAEYSVTAGEHRVRVVRSGYTSYDGTVTVRAGGNEQLSPVLVEQRMINRSEIGFSAYYLLATKNELTPGPLFAVFFAHTAGVVQPGLEFAFARQRHDMNIYSSGGAALETERYYNNFYLQAYINIIPFQWQYAMPYAGVMAGLLHLRDYEKLLGETNLVDYQNLFVLTGRVGISVIPFSFFSIFAEARFHYHPAMFTHDTFVYYGTTPVQYPGRIPVHYWSVGGGIKFLF